MIYYTENSKNLSLSASAVSVVLEQIHQTSLNILNWLFNKSPTRELVTKLTYELMGTESNPFQMKRLEKKKKTKQINSNKNHLNQKTGEKEKPDFKKNTPKKPLHVKLLSLIFLSIFTFILHSFPFSFSYMRGENTEA